MILYKAIGGLLILGMGGYVSLSISRYERRRLRVLDAYISLIYYIKGQIDCYALPVGDILARADPALIAACLGLERDDRDTAELLACFVGTDSPLPRLVNESRLYLEPESERLLRTFSGELGHTFRTEQVARCDYYISALTEERRKLFAALPARVRVSSVLCICCALGATVLLW